MKQINLGTGKIGNEYRVTSNNEPIEVLGGNKPVIVLPGVTIKFVYERKKGWTASKYSMPVPPWVENISPVVWNCNGFLGYRK